MPSSFFTFQQGSDSRSIPPPDAHSLRYGRFRAFSPASKNSNSNLFSVFSGEFGESSYQAGYGSINITTGAEGDETAGDDEPDDRWWLDRLLISPRRKMVKSMVGLWWRRWAILILLPAVIVCSPRARPCLRLTAGKEHPVVHDPVSDNADSR